RPRPSPPRPRRHGALDGGPRLRLHRVDVRYPEPRPLPRPGGLRTGQLHADAPVVEDAGGLVGVRPAFRKSLGLEYTSIPETKSFRRNAARNIIPLASSRIGWVHRGVPGSASASRQHTTVDSWRITENHMPSEKQVVETIEKIGADMSGFIAGSLVDMESGLTLGAKSMRSDFDLSVASAYNSELVKQKLKIMRALNLKS